MLPSGGRPRTFAISGLVLLSLLLLFGLRQSILTLDQHLPASRRPSTTKLPPLPSRAPSSSAAHRGAAEEQRSGRTAGAPSLTPLRRPPTTASSAPASNKVAAIIETRPLDNVIPLILHFGAVLGPDWPIVVFTLPEAMGHFFNSSSAFRRQVAAQRVSVRALPADAVFSTRGGVSKFLTQAWVWEQLAPARHVLLFQADSIVCSNAPVAIDDFLSYDFVGAPIAPQYGRGYNGGLSLRSRELVLQIVRNASWEQELAAAQPAGGKVHEWNIAFEDQWFVMKMAEMGPDRARLPSEEVAKTFAVETIAYERPLGYHQATRWQQPNLQAIEKYCPEWRMCVTQTY
ncbi:MAG: hypothetical protein M1826_002404 [Phylliscum demangeonii]|nr:MAG: hypothetical protein M1826_002404 [Phylliscum demangeonii]